ncbi:MAG: hypothetical protein KC777_17995 [Cyanobacteria bacterium HKST-UBA02]|nr:hypothetical protein [Cyanobacteria bacterium HKST-UBA02]
MSKNDSIFLSEFKNPCLFLNPVWASVSALVIVLSTLVVLALGELCGANGLYIQIRPILPGSDLDFEPIIIWKGYLGEINHGFFYLLIAPLCFLTLYRFFVRADESLYRLKNRGLVDNETVEHVKARNKRLFSPLTCLAPRVKRDIKNQQLKGILVQSLGFQWLLWTPIVVMTYFNFNREISSIDSKPVTTGHSKAIGYIQVPRFHNWKKRFVSGDTDMRLQMIKEVSALDAGLKRSIERRMQEMTDAQPVFQAWVRAGATIRSDGTKISVSELPLSREDKQQLRVNLASAVRSGLLRFNLKTNARELSNYELFIHQWFVRVLLVLESTFHGLAIFVVFKVLFWIVSIGLLLPRWKDQKHVIQVVFDDPAHYYGMQPLNAAYNEVIYLIIFACFVFVSMYNNNLGKGLILQTSSIEQTAISAFLTAAFIVIVIAVIALGPMYLYSTHMKAIKTRREDELYAVLSSDKDKKLSLETLERLEQQETWPKHDPHFLRAFLLAFALLAVPVFLQFGSSISIPIPREVEAAASVEGQIQRIINAICVSRYFR